MKRRNHIEAVPELTWPWKHIGVGMKVEPLHDRRDRWQWHCYYTFDGHRSLMGYTMSSWRRPSPYEVVGRSRDEGDAWLAARECADDARARFAAEQIRCSRMQTSHVPL